MYVLIPLPLVQKLLWSGPLLFVCYFHILLPDSVDHLYKLDCSNSIWHALCSAGHLLVSSCDTLALVTPPAFIHMVVVPCLPPGWPPADHVSRTIS